MNIARVERHKVVDYLLNPAHPDDGGKAQFFESRGFSVDVPELLIDLEAPRLVTAYPGKE